MALIAELAAVIAPVFLLALAGWIWGKRGYDFDHGFITVLITRIGAPALVVTTLVKMPFQAAEMGKIIGATLLCLICFAVIGAVILRLAGLRQKVYLPSLVFPNIGNMGLPVCLYAFGERGLALAMIYFTICTIGQFTLGPAIASGRFDLRGLLRMPFLHAVGLALLLRGFGIALPKWLDNSLSLTAGMTIPLMLLALGVALAQLQVRQMGRTLTLSLLRLGMGAAVGWAVATAFGLDDVFRGVLILQSAMPVAVFNYLFARAYNNQPEDVAGLVMLSTLVSLLLLPLQVAWLLPAGP